MSNHTFTADMLIGEIIGTDASAIATLQECGMGCVGCPASQSETLADACMVHGIDTVEVLSRLNGEN
mgnify:CR=1 FL=1